MGQWLSLPFIALGIYMIWRGMTHPAAESTPAQHKEQGSRPATPKKMKR